MNPFTWIRRKTAEAYMLGTSDYMQAITPEGETPPTNLGELRAMLSGMGMDVKALAAPPTPTSEPSAEPEATGKRKAK